MRTVLEMAEKALARGDYEECLDILHPLSEQYPLSGNQGSEIRMLMVTAFMGQGNNQEAISTCRLITKSKNTALRHRAKQLLDILEAPSLQRPENWSIQLPKVEDTTFTDKGSRIRNKNTKRKELISNHPPTGDTKGLGMGFSTLVFVIFLVLTILLSI